MSGTTYEKLFVKIAQYLSVSNQQFFVPTKSRFDIDIAKFHRNKFSGVNKCNAFILSWYNNKYTMTCDFIAEPDSSKFMLYLRKRSKGGFNLIPLLLKYRDSITKQIVVKKILKKKLQDRLQNPVIESARVHGIKDCYKIKLRQTGYRLVYKVIKKEVVILVVAVGKRERNAAYKLASKRI